MVNKETAFFTHYFLCLLSVGAELDFGIDSAPSSKCACDGIVHRKEYVVRYFNIIYTSTVVYW